MANAAAKRIASQNEQAVRNLRLGMLVSLALSVLFRALFRRSSLFPSIGLTAIFVVTLAPAVVLYRYLVKIGTTRRDASGALISSGEDLNQPGITEWCFDVLYITWACQVGSAAFGEWVWWLYLSIPLYALYKFWSTFMSPGSSSDPVDSGTNDGEAVSKRQEKLRKRAERGDPKMRSVPGKR